MHPQYPDNLEQVLNKIGIIVRRVFGEHATVTPFGSSVIPGFWRPGSDLDVTVDPISNGPLSRIIDRVDDAGKRKCLQRMFAEVSSLVPSWNVQAILGARVPIIKVVEPSTGMRVDISIQNDLPIYRSKLLSAYALIDSRFAQLAVALKAWAKAKGIGDARNHTLSSYCSNLLLLFYLQKGVKPPILPCLQAPTITLKADALRRALRQGRARTVTIPEPTLVDGRNVSFHEHTHLVGWGSDNQTPIKDLLRGFFKFYAFQHVLTESPVSVSGQRPQFFKHRSPFAVVDPFDSSDNCARSITVGSGRRVMQLITQVANCTT